MCGALVLLLAAAALPSSLCQSNESSQQPGAQASAPVPSVSGVFLESEHVDLSSMPFYTVQVHLLPPASSHADLFSSPLSTGIFGKQVK